MPRYTITVAVPLLLASFAGSPLLAQAPATPPDPFISAVTMGNVFLRHQVTTAASQMSEEDYAFRPTPEVRTFGQLVAHIADSNYLMCSEANGEATPPVRHIEKTRTTRAEIDTALAESFTYCAGVYATMTDAKAKSIVQFGKSRLPALAVLMFQSMHNSLHYGNVITYLRLRGKVPPPASR